MTSRYESLVTVINVMSCSFTPPGEGALESFINPHIKHHHMTTSEAKRPMAELAAEEGAELHRSELQHLKVKLET